MIKLKSHVGIDMKLGGLEQRATIFVAETISRQHEHAEYNRGVGASWEEGGRVKKGACVDVKNWRG